MGEKKTKSAQGNVKCSAGSWLSWDTFIWTNKNLIPKIFLTIYDLSNVPKQIWLFSMV